MQNFADFKIKSAIFFIQQIGHIIVRIKTAELGKIDFKICYKLFGQIPHVKMRGQKLQNLAEFNTESVRNVFWADWSCQNEKKLKNLAECY